MNADEKLALRRAQHAEDIYSGRYHTMVRALQGAHVGIKRLKRKVEVRDAYVKACEKLFERMQEEGAPNSAYEFREFMEMSGALRTARENLGLIKKPRTESPMPRPLKRRDGKSEGGGTVERSE